MRTIKEMVQSEVLCCMSSMVSTLAQGYGAVEYTTRNGHGSELRDLTEQAFELASPVPDYEEAAIQEGWKISDSGLQFVNENEIDEDTGQCEAFGALEGGNASVEDWQALCQKYDIEPYDREVFEHWAVTDWFADKLIEHGEKVDKDFAGLCVWARCTTGQGIAQDGVIERIHASLCK